jgi:3-oxoacyl-[acyl-carrier protein] reductase
MDLGIKGKTALVTGASSGLGFAAALALAHEGVQVVINSRSEKNLQAAAIRIEQETGYRPIALKGDLSVDGTAERLVEETVSRVGKLDILVSNAGGPPAGSFLELDKEAWKKSAQPTFHSAVDLARAALPHMLKNRWGRIIFITSVAVKQPIDNLIISNALRAGIVGFAKSISNQVAADGITVNAVMPGYTETERLKYLAKQSAESSGQTEDEIYKVWIDRVPAGRLGRPDELAALIAFLASEKAAYITGAAVPVDGGYIKSIL